ncbi:MAG: hypothetical protein JW725_05390, partial [Candidatus Babeliaceae bacterium]|nr:hypothetical protein [Candidatus Babeliaceae bacterium]
SRRRQYAKHNISIRAIFMPNRNLIWSSIEIKLSFDFYSTGILFHLFQVSIPENQLKPVADTRTCFNVVSYFHNRTLRPSVTEISLKHKT